AMSKSSDTPLATEMGLPDLLGLGDPEPFSVTQSWTPRPHRDNLRAPIGAGKSELLRTLVMALAATHSSEALNFVLIDFKGGATFASLDRLPHTAAVITNLADELPLVDRMVDAISGELTRRQEQLRRA